MNRLQKIVVGFLIVLCLGVIGAQDYEAELAEVELYCQRVRDGVWPDYLGTYAEACAPSSPHRPQAAH